MELLIDGRISEFLLSSCGIIYSTIMQYHLARSHSQQRPKAWKHSGLPFNPGCTLTFFPYRRNAASSLGETILSYTLRIGNTSKAKTLAMAMAKVRAFTLDVIMGFRVRSNNDYLYGTTGKDSHLLFDHFLQARRGIFGATSTLRIRRDKVRTATPSFCISQISNTFIGQRSNTI